MLLQGRSLYRQLASYEVSFLHPGIVGRCARADDNLKAGTGGTAYP